jgi:hypothetical protein
VPELRGDLLEGNRPGRQPLAPPPLQQRLRRPQELPRADHQVVRLVVCLPQRRDNHPGDPRRENSLRRHHEVPVPRLRLEAHRRARHLEAPHPLRRPAHVHNGRCAGETPDLHRPPFSPHPLEHPLPHRGDLRVGHLEAVQEHARAHPRVPHVREPKLVRPLLEQGCGDENLEPMGPLAGKRRLAHEAPPQRGAHVMVGRDPGLRPALQRDPQPRRLPRSRVHAGQSEALRSRHPRPHPVPQPQVRCLQQPRLVDPVRLEGGKPRRGRDDRPTQRRSEGHPHLHLGRAHELVGHLRGVVHRGGRPVRIEVQDAPRAEHRPRRLDVEGNRLALPLQTQEQRREPSGTLGKQILVAHRVKTPPRGVKLRQDVLRDSPLARHRASPAPTPALPLRHPRERQPHPDPPGQNQLLL